MALVRAVDLVDRDDRANALAQCLGYDELRLRQRPFGGIHQQHCTVDHVENALDLTAEVGVARRIDDIDARTVPDDGGILGEDRDPTLALEII